MIDEGNIGDNEQHCTNVALCHQQPLMIMYYL